MSFCSRKHGYFFALSLALLLMATAVRGDLVFRDGFEFLPASVTVLLAWGSHAVALVAPLFPSVSFYAFAQPGRTHQDNEEFTMFYELFLDNSLKFDGPTDDGNQGNFQKRVHLIE